MITARLLFVGLVLLVYTQVPTVPMACAQNLVFCEDSSQSWSDLGNWFTDSCGGTPAGALPSGTANVTILTNQDAVISGATAAICYKLTLQSGATVTLAQTSADGGHLQIVGDGATVVSTIASGAKLILGDANNGNHALVEVQGTHSISGDGEIEGSDSSAAIQIASGKQLTSSVLVHGALTISGLGSFANHGVVEADDPNGGTLGMTVAFVTDIEGCDRWMCTVEDATLWFSDSIAGAAMEGEWVLLDGTILVEQSITTDGRLRMGGGVLDVADGHLIMGCPDENSCCCFMDASGGKIIARAGSTFTHVGAGTGCIWDPEECSEDSC